MRDIYTELSDAIREPGGSGVVNALDVVRMELITKLARKEHSGVRKVFEHVERALMYAEDDVWKEVNDES